MSESSSVSERVRREPPPFLTVVVGSTDVLGPRMMRVTLQGDDLARMKRPQPAASVRLLLPPPGAELEIPTWRGNEFLNADGSRPIIRTFTPRLFDPPEIVIDLVIHPAGMASAWAESAQPGDVAAVSGPARGYDIDTDADSFLLAGDESAIPAMSQLLEVLPDDRPVAVHIAATTDFGRVEIPGHPQADVTWHDADAGRGLTLVAAVAGDALVSSSNIWVAGEAAAVQQVRKYLFQDLGVPRSQAVVRGYWK